MNNSDLKNARSAARAEYAAATDRMLAAYVELAALDIVWITKNGGRPDACRTFGHLPQNLGLFEHPEATPVNHAVCCRDQINARRDELLKAFEKGA